MRKELFADVILPLALRNTFTYSVPEPLQKKIKIGMRAVVEFKTQKLYTALVCKIHENKPAEYKTKPIENILDEVPVVNELQLRFWKWMADYYLCTIGEVMNAALPSGLKLSSETKILLNSSYTYTPGSLSDDEYLVYEALQSENALNMDDVGEITSKRKAPAVIKSLLEKKAACLQEELREKYKPKMAVYVRLTSFADDEKNLEEIFKVLEEEKKQDQLELVIAYIKLSQRNSKTRKEVKKSELLEYASTSESSLKSLIRKNIFEVYKKETGRFSSESAQGVSKSLSEEQKNIFKKIKSEWQTKETVLLHGVTSSGKTEIYVKLIEETLAQGKQALYLLPEIALTTQVTARIKKYFGDKLGVYHSRFNENERVEIWNQVSTAGHKFRVILGARSSLFLPFSNLGLIIADEEHDSSYKQQDPAPRYNARDAAMVLAKMHGAKVLLGSATPSVESYFNAIEKKYGLAELRTRHGGAQLPEILIADIKQAARLKQMKSHFSPILLDNISNALKEKEQVIIFQNRRGFAPFLECQACGWIPQCRNCDVSVVYHKTGNTLRCHYCGFTLPLPSACKKCGDTNIKMKNFGTEKIEEELEIFFPDARIARMDLDSTRTKFAYQHLINDFEERNIDILVGTQMVTKGLDFDNVGVVGILSADQMLNFPDFRSHERSFQVMSQVAGRAGRKNKGKVILQTSDPTHRVIRHVMDHDFEKMFKEEIEHRKNFNYPPFYRLLELTVMHRDMDTINIAADELAQKLKSFLGKRVLGPEFDLIPRIKNLYRKKILLKISREESSSKVKEKVFELISRLQNNDTYKALKVQADVDPL